jgi:hypothetical protein
MECGRFNTFHISYDRKGDNMSKKKEEIDLNNIKPEEKMKYEIAEELGYLDKVMATGWKSLTAKESGRIGGLITKRKNELKNK